MTWLSTGMFAATGANSTTLFLASHALRIIYRVTLDRAQVIATLETEATWSATSAWLAVPTGPRNGFVVTQARNRYLYLTFRMWQLEKFNRFRLHIPRTGCLPILVHRPGQHGVMAFGKTRVLTVGRIVIQLTRFNARRTIAFVAAVAVLVVTLGGSTTRQETLWWLGFLRTSTRNFNDRSLAAALEAGLKIARITGTRMTHGLTPVLRAAEWLVADLVTRWTLAIAALPAAKMQFTAAQFLALGLATEGFAAAHLLRLQATETALLNDVLALK